MRAAASYRALLLWAIALWLSGVPVASVAAHAPPEVRRVLLDATGMPRVLVANRGLIFRGDDSPQLMCNEALGLSTSQLPAVVLRDETSLLAATPQGLLLTSDGACSWQRQDGPAPTLSLSSLVQAPDAAEVLWLAANGGAAAGLYASADAGRSWQRQWTAQPDDYLQDVLLAPGSPRRVFALRARVDAQAVRYSVLASSDGGETWQEHALALQDEEQPSLLAVDPEPTAPARLIAKATLPDAAQRQRLLLSRDGGESFASPLSLYAINAASWSDDGARAWVASEEGLFLSSDRGERFARVGPGELLTCVLEQAGRLYTCGFFAGVAAGMEGVGVSEDTGQTFQSLLLFREVQAALACSPQSETARSCELPWRDWRSEQGSAGAADSGAPLDAGAQHRDTERAKRSSGCEALPLGVLRSPTADVAMLIAMLALVLRRVRCRASTIRVGSSEVGVPAAACPSKRTPDHRSQETALHGARRRRI